MFLLIPAQPLSGRHNQAVDSNAVPDSCSDPECRTLNRMTSAQNYLLYQTIQTAADATTRRPSNRQRCRQGALACSPQDREYVAATRRCRRKPACHLTWHCTPSACTSLLSCKHNSSSSPHCSAAAPAPHIHTLHSTVPVEQHSLLSCSPYTTHTLKSVPMPSLRAMTQ